ncbi:MAG: transglutaminase family protein [Verrucomicrobia bacterium]|nr:transglutaminase family protein [Verrucomicrobiota bacterium]
MKIHVSHLSRYEYDREVSFSPHLLYMRPRENPLLRVNSFGFNISPEAKVIWTRDSHDNLLAWAHFWERSHTLSIRSEFVVETLDVNPFDFILKPYALTFPFEYEALYAFNLTPYLAPPFPETRAALLNWLDEHFVDRPKETVPFLVALNNLVHQTLIYKRRDERGIQPSLTTLQLGTGSCRDYAVLFIELCRTLGIAARFVSGYLFDPATDSPSTGAMHAWTEVYLPGGGWKGVDPTHGIWCDDAFVPVAHAAVADSVNPIQGSYYAPEPVPSKLTHSVLVEKMV